MTWKDLIAGVFSGVNISTLTETDSLILQTTAQDLTEPAEGLRLSPYQDSGGVWTIGTGSTFDLAGRPVTKDTPAITPAQNILLLSRDLGSALRTVKADVKVVLTSGEKEALVDLVFNIGSGNFAASTVLRQLNAGNYDAACDAIAMWNKDAHGQVLLGLVKRRAAEQAKFKS